ncbi:methyl-accepting chemotaxis sensory transducer [Candidatus Vecturithrix granuli]|uniref:Methyl-accepting chemotaxis sensory transducer n=1 Tax=Vecturithrix granuli TaxID=1499967 RepID=A0A081C642_VECG1|nr:methyl-accepting chemotaxis sensory transducer [Candidatus Vecturithrix granuli]
MKTRTLQGQNMHSIQVKIGAAIIASTTLILLVFGVYQYYDMSTRKISELRGSAEQIAAKLAGGLVVPLWDYDRKQTAYLLTSEMQNRAIYGIVVKTAAGDSIFTGKMRSDDWQIIDTQETIEGEFIVSSSNVVKDDKTLGLVEVYLTRRFLQQELLSEMIKIVIMVLVLDISIFLILTLTLRSLLLRPIHTFLALANGVAAGNFDQTINITQRDEIGALAEAFRTMQTTMQQITELAERIAIGDMTVDVRKRSEHDRLMGALEKMIGGMKEIAQSAEEMANGNLTVVLEERSEQDTLMQALNAMIEHLQSVVTDVQRTAKTIGTVSQELSSSSEQLSNGASEQAASMEESSSSMEEMAANIRQSAENAKQTEKIALQSAEYAEEAGRVVAETVVAMQQIAQKIAIIQDIANQTRTLSLNATIEAARAQDHGKAFSVVASEVRQLSEVTKKAAEEISQLAASSLDVSEKAGMMLSTLVPSIQKTTELIQEISAASNEQSTGAEQINRAIQQADQVTQQNAAIAEQTASSAEELASQAQQLQHTIAFFRIDESDLEQQTSDKKPHPEKSSALPRRPGKMTKGKDEQPPSLDRDVYEDGNKYDEEFERF